MGKRTDILLADIGNSAVTLARSAGGRIKKAIRLVHGGGDFASGVARYIAEAKPRACAAVSVNTGALRRLKSALRDAGVKKFLLAGKDFRIPIRNRTARPEQTGDDRLLGALAAFRRAGSACIVVDAGSAVTVDLVDGNGAFLGGAILPGGRMAAESLADGTDRLPLVQPAPPRNPVGCDTEKAVRAGLYAATAGAAAWLVEKYRRKLGVEAPVFVTGGDAMLVAPAVKPPVRRAAELVLEGLLFAAVERIEKP